MSLPRVCILTAGRGTRLGEGYSWINKALLPLNDRAVISHLIDRFPEQTEFVIGLGHLGEQVRRYLRLMHPGRVFHFVDVEPWSGPGSGPGRSLLCCRGALPGAFVFVPCDTLPEVEIDPSAPGDWAGVQRVAEGESDQYCNFRLEDGRVVGIRDKEAVDQDSHRAFTGLMRIESADTFWEALESGGEVAGEHQVSAGLGALQARGGLRAIDTPSVDVGRLDLYRAEVVRRQGFDFSKPGETLYLDQERVVKLFADEENARLRRDRGRSLGEASPPMLDSEGGFVAYRFVPGTTLYRVVTPELLGSFLDWAGRELWRSVSVPSEAFAGACGAFYRDKTLERVEKLRGMGGLKHEPARVNGTPVPTTDELLGRIDWGALSRGGSPVVFHGDLQFDNVLQTETGDFALLDWRQDFAGRTDAGDLDYDLAKLVGGIRVDYARVKGGEVEHGVDRAGNATLGLPSAPRAEELEAVVLERSIEMGRDPARVRLLTGLIHLNMAPLHAEPFGSAMRDLARLELASCLGVRAAA